MALYTRFLLVLALAASTAAAQDACEADCGPGLVIAGGVQTAVAGRSDTVGPDPETDDRGLGGVVIVTQGLAEYLVARVRLGAYRTKVAAFTATGEREPDSFSLLSAGGAVMFQARMGGPFTIRFGPQVSAGRYRYVYSAELQAALDEGGAIEVVRDDGVRWAADVAVEVVAEAPFGVGLVAGLDAPIGRTWGDQVDIELRGLADAYSRQYRVPIPRLHLGASVRIR